jgi:hypothetical protein
MPSTGRINAGGRGLVFGTRFQDPFRLANPLQPTLAALQFRGKLVAGQPSDSTRPDPKAQYNFTDPESRIMKGPDGFVQAYNVQIAVDTLQLIVGHSVTQQTNDKKQLLPMITTIAQQSGDTPSQLLADAGYCSDANLTAIADTAIADTPIDAYISTRKQKHGERPGPVRAARCRSPPRSPTGCPASCWPSLARRSTRHAKASSNRCLDRSSRRVASDNSC